MSHLVMTIGPFTNNYITLFSFSSCYNYPKDNLYLGFFHEQLFKHFPRRSFCYRTFFYGQRSFVRRTHVIFQEALIFHQTYKMNFPGGYPPPHPPPPHPLLFLLQTSSIRSDSVLNKFLTRPYDLIQILLLLCCF